MNDPSTAERAAEDRREREGERNNENVARTLDGTERAFAASERKPLRARREIRIERVSAKTLRLVGSGRRDSSLRDANNLFEHGRMSVVY